MDAGAQARRRVRRRTVGVYAPAVGSGSTGGTGSSLTSPSSSRSARRATDATRSLPQADQAHALRVAADHADLVHAQADHFPHS